MMESMSWALSSSGSKSISLSISVLLIVLIPPLAKMLPQHSSDNLCVAMTMDLLHSLNIAGEEVEGDFGKGFFLSSGYHRLLLLVRRSRRCRSNGLYSQLFRTGCEIA